jgi:hypothetical protein
VFKFYVWKRKNDKQLLFNKYWQLACFGGQKIINSRHCLKISSQHELQKTLIIVKKCKTLNIFSLFDIMWVLCFSQLICLIRFQVLDFKVSQFRLMRWGATSWYIIFIWHGACAWCPRVRMELFDVTFPPHLSHSWVLARHIMCKKKVSARIGVQFYDFEKDR